MTTKNGKASGAEWEFSTDIRKWKLKDKNGFIRAANQAKETGDDSAMLPYMTKLVVQWPYKADPTKVESYEELTVDEFDDVSKRVLAALQAGLASRAETT